VAINRADTFRFGSTADELTAWIDKSARAASGGELV
jgi:hypothetical protein